MVKRFRYILLATVIIISAVVYYINDRELRRVNFTILDLSRASTQVNEIESELNSLCRFKSSLSDDLFNGTYSDILERVSKYVDTGFEEYYHDIELLTGKLHEVGQTNQIARDENIKKAQSLKKIRDYSLKISILFTMVILLFEIYTFRRFANEMKVSMDRIEARDYTYKLKKSPSPHYNDILDKMDSLRLKLNSIDRAIQSMMKGNGIKQTIEALFHDSMFHEYINFDRIGFAIVNGEHVTAKVGYSKTNKILIDTGYTIEIDKTSLKDIITNKESRIINNLRAYFKANPDSETTRLLIDEGYNSNLTAPIVDQNDNVIGFLFFATAETDGFTELDMIKIENISGIISSSFSKNMLIDDLLTNIITGFVNIVERRDPETSNHIIRMSNYSRIIAGAMLKDKEHDYSDLIKVEEIYRFSPLHDIGKVGIPDKVLLKHGRLTSDEMEIMMEHSRIGSKVLDELENNLSKYNDDFFTVAKNIAQHHHEKWDGTGYPSAFKGHDIPIEARIVSVADVFDALTSKRIYKPAIGFSEAVEMIKNESGKSFDPDVVNAFINSLDSIKEIYLRLKEV